MLKHKLHQVSASHKAQQRARTSLQRTKCKLNCLLSDIARIENIAELLIENSTVLQRSSQNGKQRHSEFCPLKRSQGSCSEGIRPTPDRAPSSHACKAPARIACRHIPCRLQANRTAARAHGISITEVTKLPTLNLQALPS